MSTKIGSEFQVNNYTSSYQNNPSIATLTDGNFVITWQSDGQDGDSYGIYAQIFQADGTKEGSEWQVNSYTTNSQGTPAVVGLANGDFVITWNSGGQDGDGSGIYAQIFLSNGTQYGGEFQVNTYTIEAQDKPISTALTNGNFVIAWESWKQDGHYHGVFAQLIQADGTVIGSEFRVNSYTTHSQFFPAITHLDNGNFVLCWRSITQGNSRSTIFAQQFQSNSTKFGSAFQVDALDVYTAEWSAIAGLNNNDFVISWTSNIQDGDSYGIYLQLFQADGSKFKSEFRVNTNTIRDQKIPDIIGLRSNNFIVSWIGPSTMGDATYSIFAKIYEPDGTQIGSEFEVNTYTTASQQYCKIAPLYNDNYVVTWESSGQDGDSYGIYAQIFYAGDLTVTNFNQAIGYTEDTTQAIIGPYIYSMYDVDVTLTLSNIVAGTLTTGTVKGINSTYNANTGIWQAFGEVNAVNSLLANTLTLIPAPDYNQDITLDISVTDTNTSIPVTGLITINGIPVDDAPILINDGATFINYIQDSDPVAIGTNLHIIDIDGVTLAQANISITSNFVPTEDKLQFNNTVAGISENYDANTGIMNLMGTASLLDYEQALHLIKYVNTGAVPNTATRTVSFGVDDGFKVSNIITQEIAILPIDSPVLVNNQMIIEENDSLILTTFNLNANDRDTPDNNIIFAIINVQGGQFELLTVPGIAITSFTQQQIKDTQVKFVQDGEEGVSYDVSVSDGTSTTPPEAAKITFINVNDPPEIIGNIKDRIIPLKRPFNFTVNPNTLFYDAEQDPLTYHAQLTDGQALPSWLAMQILSNQSLLFSGLARKSGTTQVSLLATDIHNANASTDFALTVERSGSSNTVNIPAIAAGTAVGIIVILTCLLACLIATGIISTLGLWEGYRHQKNKHSREGYQLADALRVELNLSGVDNFTSDKGLMYVNAVDALVNELKIAGHDVSSLYQNEIETFAAALAVTIKKHVPYSTTLTGKIKMDPSELQLRATIIANSFKGQDTNTLIRNTRAMTLGQFTPASRFDLEMNPINVDHATIATPREMKRPGMTSASPFGR